MCVVSAFCTDTIDRYLRTTQFIFSLTFIPSRFFFRNGNRPHRSDAFSRAGEGNPTGCGDVARHGAGRRRQQIPQAYSFRNGFP